jgi:hypothetical protein
MRVTRLLKTDVDELVEAEARWWTRLLHRHPVATTAVDLAVLGVLIILAWTFLGPTYGGLALVATFALFAFSALRVWRRHRHARR